MSYKNLNGYHNFFVTCLRSLHWWKCNVFNCLLKADAERNIIDTTIFLLPKYGTFNIIKIKAELNSWVKASKGISYEAAISSTFSTTTTTTHWTKHTRTLEAVVLLVLTVTSGGSAARLCNRRMLSSTPCKYYQTHIIHNISVVS